MAKTKIAVLFGGVSSEYEVSCKSAASVIRNIPEDRFDTVYIGISKDGRWYQYFGEPEKIEDASWIKDTENLIPAYVSPDRGQHGIMHGTVDDDYEPEHIDVAFPILHGKNGEDGTIQGLFELAGIPYVGCPVLASAACMDKAVTNTILDHYGIPHTPWYALQNGDPYDFDALADKWETEFGYPMFVKPANAGSSVGITKARDRGQLRAALDLAFQHDNKAVIEKSVSGRELECSVLGNLDPIASAPGEILPADGFYDYDEKYNASHTNTVTVADLTDEQKETIRSTAIKAYKILGCRGFARVDFLMDSATGKVFLNEINTIPGFTSISMFPKMMEAAGIPYPELITRLIDLAIEREKLGI